MGRTLKRVPIDFKWKLHQIWKGYLNPYDSQTCKACNGSGLNEATKKLHDDWYTHLRTDGQEGWGQHLEQEDIQALIDHNRLNDFNKTTKATEQNESENNNIPTAEEVNQWAKIGLGHDSINQWICVEAKAKRLGIFGECEYCNGEGVIWQSEEIKALHENWKEFEPPLGNGFQLWETTSEGSPISPVFETLETLCQWCETNATTFGHFKTTAKEWYEMLKQDFVVHKSGNSIFI